MTGDPYSVTCPVCHAAPEMACMDPIRRRREVEPHDERRRTEGGARQNSTSVSQETAQDHGSDMDEQRIAG
jgi:hypothetical protein